MGRKKENASVDIGYSCQEKVCASVEDDVMRSYPDESCYQARPIYCDL